MPGESKVMTDHDEIRKWAEMRSGHPATVAGTGGERDAGLLRIDFPGYKGKQSLREISWEEFFEKFEEKNLAVLYQAKTATGRESRFFKLINRDSERRSANRRDGSSPGDAGNGDDDGRTARKRGERTSTSRRGREAVAERSRNRRSS